jgi:hypothetical protein
VVRIEMYILSEHKRYWEVPVHTVSGCIKFLEGIPRANVMIRRSEDQTGFYCTGNRNDVLRYLRRLEATLVDSKSTESSSSEKEILVAKEDERVSDSEFESCLRKFVEVLRF